MNWLNHLKVGDAVVRIRAGKKSYHTIAKITASQVKISGVKHGFWKDTGRDSASTGNVNCFIKPDTERDLEEIFNSPLVRRQCD